MSTLKTLRRYGPPALMVTAGGGLLFAQAQNYDWIEKVWPVFIMLPGLPLLFIAWNSHEAGRVRLIFPGAIIAGTGVILQFQVITDYWRSWTYAWTLYAVFFGLSLWFQGQRLKIQQDVRIGRWMTVGGVAGFFVLWLLFQTVIFSELYAGIMSYLAAGLLIGGGLLWGINRFRVARVLAGKQVIHAKAPQSEGGTVDQVAESKTDVLRKQLEERRARMDQQPEPEEVPEEDILVEYRPPKEIIVEGHEPTTDIDPDLDAKIRAALDDEG